MKVVCQNEQLKISGGDICPHCGLDFPQQNPHAYIYWNGPAGPELPLPPGYDLELQSLQIDVGMWRMGIKRGRFNAG